MEQRGHPHGAVVVDAGEQLVVTEHAPARRTNAGGHAWTSATRNARTKRIPPVVDDTGHVQRYPARGVATRSVKREADEVLDVLERRRGDRSRRER